MQCNVNKTGASKEYIVCHDWYFINKVFKFQADVCGGRHYVLMMSINLNDIAILNICGIDYRCIINGISKSKAINLLKMLIELKKLDHYKIQFFFIEHKRSIKEL